MDSGALRSRGRQYRERPVSGPFGSTTPLRPERAFVVHLREGAAHGAGRTGTAGRVEHVVSGRSIEFASLAELGRFMARMAGRGDPRDAHEGGAG